MRDIFLILYLSIFVSMTIRFPVIGIYLWAWVSLLNPHRMVFGFLADQPINQIIAIVTIGAVLMNPSDLKNFRFSRFLIWVSVFVGWYTLTTFVFAVSPTAPNMWDRNAKIMLLIALCTVVVNNPVRINGLIWVILVSLGFYGLWGGLRTIVTAGAGIINGPEQSQLSDRNHLALALAMTIPFLNYLLLNLQSRILRAGLIVQMIFTSIAIIGTFSRGGFIALSIALGSVLFQHKRKILYIVIALAMLGPMAMQFVPQQYLDRISTISNASEDSSFQGRVDAWLVAFQAAADFPFGTGFEGPIQPAIWDRYLPGVESHAAHSIYFQVLGEQGWPGLIIYLVVLFSVWRAMGDLIRLGKSHPDRRWAYDLAIAVRTCLLVFATGGGALSVAYSDTFFLMVCTGISAHTYISRNVEAGSGMNSNSKLRPKRIGSGRKIIPAV
ncbi:MAG: putative O-glycosylation ligase, exosortase A system-associated [Rhodobacteraceae bacterium]|nr:putative O-glycosylation ligase, exosortase A system-associated [Paracoccaceae bacterium]